MKPTKGPSAGQAPRPSDSREKRTITEFDQAGGTSGRAPAGSQQSQAKRQRTIEASFASNSQPGMSETAGPKAPSPVKPREPAEFQLNMGVRKLAIKNLKPSKAGDLSKHYGTVRARVLEAVTAILRDQRPRQPLERLYRDVEDLCRNNEGETLYKALRQQCKDYLEKSVLESLQVRDHRGDPLSFLTSLLDAWKDWNMKTLRIRSVFSYLDRSYLLNSKDYQQLNDLAIMLFSTVICENPAMDAQLYDAINKMIDNDRKHPEPDPARWFSSSLLKDTTMMLLVTNLYGSKFEPRFLDYTREFLKEYATQTDDLRTYISRCVDLLAREATRCDLHNFASETKRSLTLSAQDILIKDQSDLLLDVDAVGKLLAAHDVESLKALYGLLKVSHIEGRLKAPWETYIKKAGAAIVSDREKGDDMVIHLLELKRSVELVIRDAFHKDDAFKFMMREAYSSFINDRKNTATWGAGNSKVGEVIARYVDLLLRGGLKAIPRSLAFDEQDRQDAEKQGVASTGDEDAELDRQLEQGLELFRFIEGKDVFEAFYKKDLARRLLMGRSASQDAERNMLTKLKSECGSNFTHNLEQMFKDQELSRDEMVSYSQSLADADTSKSAMSLNVSVLSAAAWPSYPDIKINLPAEIARHIENFDRHYKSKHSGRRLTWMHSLSHSIVRARFKSGMKELQVSGFQAIVLVLFNDIDADEALSYEAIQSATGLVDIELVRILQSLACGKVRVLAKHPKGRDVGKTDTFTVSANFTDPKFRIKINQIQLKETKEENKETHERVSLDRQYETQAAIVRIMKSRKVLPHQGLVAEVIEQTKVRGAVEVGEIKKNIEKLIEKDYIEREGGNYTYLA